MKKLSKNVVERIEGRMVSNNGMFYECVGIYTTTHKYISRYVVTIYTDTSCEEIFDIKCFESRQDLEKYDNTILEKKFFEENKQFQLHSINGKTYKIICYESMLNIWYEAYNNDCLVTRGCYGDVLEYIERDGE